MRRGSASVGRRIEAGATAVTIQQVECAPDGVRVTYEAPTRVGLSLAADDVMLPQVDEGFDDESQRGPVVTYPAAKSQSRLAILARGADRAIEIDLP